MMEFITILTDACIWILKILLIVLTAIASGLFLAWLKEKNGKKKRTIHDIFNQFEEIKKNTGFINQKIMDMYILVSNYENNNTQTRRELLHIRNANRTILSCVQMIDNSIRMQRLIGMEVPMNPTDDNLQNKLLDLPMENIRLNVIGNSTMKYSLGCETIRDVLKAMITNQRRGLKMYRRLGEITIRQLETFFVDSGLLKIENGIYSSDIISCSDALIEIKSSQ